MISGQIDLIVKTDPESNKILDVDLIDFKTEKKEGRRERDPLNRLQLRLYALAAGKSLGLNPISSHIHYLSDNVRFDVDVSEENLVNARKDINKAVKGIKSRRFGKKPGKNCDSCDFHLICSK